MDRSTVDIILRDYKLNLGRQGHLSNAVEELKGMIKKARSRMIDEAALHGQVYSDMPHGTDVGQPTERIAIKFADGYVPEFVEQMEKELEANENELDLVTRRIVYAEAWVKGLQDKERFVIQNQVIEAFTWKEVIAKYRATYGYEYSKDTLKNIKAKAMEKIYKFAE